MRTLLLLTFTALVRLAAERPSPFGFAPPEITLADFNTRSLRSGDFNQDGKTDLVLLNPDRGRLDFFLQQAADAKVPPPPTLRADRWQPVLSHPRLRRESLVPGNPLLALCVGDFNGDGVDDFAVTDDQNQLLIYHGPLRPDWRPAARLSVTATQAAPEVLAFDPVEKALILLGRTEIQEVRWDAVRREYTATTPASPPPDEQPSGLILRDFNGDGVPDVLYSLRGERFNLAVHLRRPDGLGNVLRPALDPPAVQFHAPAGDTGSLLALHPRSRALQVLKFGKTEEGDPLENSLRAHFLHFPPLRNPESLRADFDGDGLPDLLLLPPGQPELIWCRGEADGGFAPPLRQPIPAGCKWMVAGTFLPGKPSPQILLHDPESGFLGISWVEEGRLRFPRNIRGAAQILGAAAWRPEGLPSDRLLGVVRDEQRAYHFRIWELQEDGEELSLHLHQEAPLPSLKRDPHPPLLCRAPSQPRPFFLLPGAFEDALLLIPDAEGKLQAVPTAEGFSSKLLNRKNPPDFLRFPAGAPLPSPTALLRDGSVLFLDVGEGGQVTVLDQLNLQQEGALRALLPLTADGTRLGLLDGTRNRMEVQARGEDGIFAFAGSLDLPPLQISQIGLERGQDDTYALWFSGRSQAGRIFAQSPVNRILSRVLMESDLPGFTPDQLVAGDFNGDGKSDMAWIDSTRTRAIEFLHESPHGWRSVMHFQIFESAIGSQVRQGADTEPREALVTDLNGDGWTDLLLLAHDRILFYAQDPPPPAAE